MLGTGCCPPPSKLLGLGVWDSRSLPPWLCGQLSRPVWSSAGTPCSCKGTWPRLHPFETIDLSIWQELPSFQENGPCSLSQRIKLPASPSPFQSHLPSTSSSKLDKQWQPCHRRGRCRGHPCHVMAISWPLGPGRGSSGV